MCKSARKWVSTLPQVDLERVLNPWNKSANRKPCSNWALFIPLKVQILKMDSHFQFGNLKLKLWQKEWYAITKTLKNEVKWCSIRTCIMTLEFFFKDYYFSLESFSIWICMQKLWTHNVTKKIFKILRFPFGVLIFFVILMQSPPPITKFIIGKKVMTPPKFKPWWILWKFVTYDLSMGPNFLRCTKFLS